MSERVILRHLKGSKSGTADEFPLESVSEIVLGRDPIAHVRFDADKDDLVGRQHARITRDPADPARFSLTDLSSRNGTFLNKLRVVGTMPLNPGDTIQLGAGGPEVRFELDPLPAAYIKATRLGGVAAPTGGERTPPATRAETPVMAGAGATATVEGNRVGKATVERMIGETRREGKRSTIYAVTAVLLVAIAGGAWMKIRADQQTKLAQGETAEAQSQAAAAQAAADSLGVATERARNLGTMMTPAEVAAANSSAVVQIDFSWNLIYAPTGGQVFHLHIANEVVVNRRRVPLVAGLGATIPAYVDVGNGILEPALTLDGSSGSPIAVTGGGSGFVVTNDGFILTNRHIAANWRAPYSIPSNMVGVLVDGDGVVLDANGAAVVVDPPMQWIPSETKQAGPKGEFDAFRGRQEYMMVRFRKNTTPFEATTQRVSDQHDVALIKVSAPSTLPKVELYDSYTETAVGDQVIVMGYPGVSASVIAVLRSRDMFNREAQQRIVPDPTVSVGNIGKILRASDGPTSISQMEFAPSGDTYQLTINSTGGGNSGGPMFDAFGRVIGIFFAMRQTDAYITFSLPIRYGMELMSVAPNSN
jgi:serine protease Do